MKAAQRLIERQKDLTNTLITADALHAQRVMANRIVERGGDFIIQVKDNQKTVHGLAAKLTQKLSPLLPTPRRLTDG